MAAPKTRRVCSNGHSFSKRSDCLTCPTCAAATTPETGFLAELSAPARNALAHSGSTTLTAVATYSEREILKLHGMGPRSMPTLRTALLRKGLWFKAAQGRSGERSPCSVVVPCVPGDRGRHMANTGLDHAPNVSAAKRRSSSGVTSAGALSAGVVRPC